MYHNFNCFDILLLIDIIISKNSGYVKAMILKIIHGRMDEISNITNLLNHEELTIDDEPYVTMIMDMIHSDLTLLGMVIYLSF